VDKNEPVAHPEHKDIVDGWVRGRGLFVQNYVDTTGGEEVPALLVVATAIERDFATVPVTSLADIPFDIVDDDPALAGDEEGRAILRKEYPRALYRLVKYADARAGASGAALRAEEGLKPVRLARREQWEELWGKPAEFRPRTGPEAPRPGYYGGLGTVVVSPLHYTPEEIDANDAGVEECLNGWLLTDEHKLVQFLAPASLDAPEWGARKRVRWEGFFYKLKLYYARDGTERLAPVFVLTVLEEMKLPPPSFLFHWILAAVLVLGLGLLFFFVMREDRATKDYRRLRRRRLAAQRPAD
jgi:hypothetical protein